MNLSTLENEYVEPVDPAPVTEEEMDELIAWFENLCRELNQQWKSPK
jgi:hypothetical protein